MIPHLVAKLNDSLETVVSAVLCPTLHGQCP